MHATYVHDNFSGKGNNGQIERLLEVLGYRLILREAAYPEEVAVGDTLQIRSIWANTGSAPPYTAFPMYFSSMALGGLGFSSKGLPISAIGCRESRSLLWPRLQSHPTCRLGAMSCELLSSTRRADSLRAGWQSRGRMPRPGRLSAL